MVFEIIALSIEMHCFWLDFYHSGIHYTHGVMFRHSDSLENMFMSQLSVQLIGKLNDAARFSYFSTYISRALGCLIITSRLLEESVQHLISLIWKIIFLLLYEPATNAC